MESIRAFRQSDAYVCEQLEKRYKMDKVIWQASQRKSFPFNLSLLAIFSICTLGVILACLHPARNIFSDYNLVACIAVTTVMSIFAYKLTDSGIVEFKGTLEKKGLFGRDLNKLGDNKDEKKEKM